MIRITIAMKKGPAKRNLPESQSVYSYEKYDKSKHVLQPPLKKAEQAPDTSPSVKNQFNIEAPG